MMANTKVKKISIEEVRERRRKALSGIGKVKILGVEFSEDPSGQRYVRQIKEEESMIKSIPQYAFF